MVSLGHNELNYAPEIALRDSLLNKTYGSWLVPLHTLLTLYMLIVFSRNINMHLQFLSFLHTDITQVVEISSHGRQGPSCFTGDTKSQGISNNDTDMIKPG